MYARMNNEGLEILVLDKNNISILKNPALILRNMVF